PEHRPCPRRTRGSVVALATAGLRGLWRLKDRESPLFGHVSGYNALLYRREPVGSRSEARLPAPSPLTPPTPPPPPLSPLSLYGRLNSMDNGDSSRSCPRPTPNPSPNLRRATTNSACAFAKPI